MVTVTVAPQRPTLPESPKPEWYGINTSGWRDQDTATKQQKIEEYNRALAQYNLEKEGILQRYREEQANYSKYVQSQKEKAEYSNYLKQYNESQKQTFNSQGTSNQSITNQTPNYYFGTPKTSSPSGIYFNQYGGTSYGAGQDTFSKEIKNIKGSIKETKSNSDKGYYYNIDNQKEIYSKEETKAGPFERVNESLQFVTYEKRKPENVTSPALTGFGKYGDYIQDKTYISGTLDYGSEIVKGKSYQGLMSSGKGYQADVISSVYGGIARVAPYFVPYAGEGLLIAEGSEYYGTPKGWEVTQKKYQEADSLFGKAWAIGSPAVDISLGSFVLGKRIKSIKAKKEVTALKEAPLIIRGSQYLEGDNYVVKLTGEKITPKYKLEADYIQAGKISDKGYLSLGKGGVSVVSEEGKILAQTFEGVQEGTKIKNVFVDGIKAEKTIGVSSRSSSKTLLTMEGKGNIGVDPLGNIKAKGSFETSRAGNKVTNNLNLGVGRVKGDKIAFMSGSAKEIGLMKLGIEGEISSAMKASGEVTNVGIIKQITSKGSTKGYDIMRTGPISKSMKPFEAISGEMQILGSEDILTKNIGKIESSLSESIKFSGGGISGKPITKGFIEKESSPLGVEDFSKSYSNLGVGINNNYLDDFDVGNRVGVGSGSKGSIKVFGGSKGKLGNELERGIKGIMDSGMDIDLGIKEEEKRGVGIKGISKTNLKSDSKTSQRSAFFTPFAELPSFNFNFKEKSKGFKISDFGNRKDKSSINNLFSNNLKREKREYKYTPSIEPLLFGGKSKKVSKSKLKMLDEKEFLGLQIREKITL